MVRSISPKRLLADLFEVWLLQLHVRSPKPDSSVPPRQTSVSEMWHVFQGVHSFQWDLTSRQASLGKDDSVPSPQFFPHVFPHVFPSLAQLHCAERLQSASWHLTKCCGRWFCGSGGSHSLCPSRDSQRCWATPPAPAQKCTRCPLREMFDVFDFLRRTLFFFQHSFISLLNKFPMTILCYLCRAPIISLAQHIKARILIWNGILITNAAHVNKPKVSSRNLLSIYPLVI